MAIVVLVLTWCSDSLHSVTETDVICQQGLCPFFVSVSADLHLFIHQCLHYKEAGCHELQRPRKLASLLRKFVEEQQFRHLREREQH